MAGFTAWSEGSHPLVDTLPWVAGADESRLDGRDLYLLACREAHRDGLLDGRDRLVLTRLERFCKLSSQEVRHLAALASQDWLRGDLPLNGEMDPYDLMRGACRLASRGEIGRREEMLLMGLSCILELSAQEYRRLTAGLRQKDSARVRELSEPARTARPVEPSPVSAPEIEDPSETSETPLEPAPRAALEDRIEDAAQALALDAVLALTLGAAHPPEREPPPPTSGLRITEPDLAKPDLAKPDETSQPDNPAPARPGQGPAGRKNRSLAVSMMGCCLLAGALPPAYLGVAMVAAGSALIRHATS